VRTTYRQVTGGDLTVTTASTVAPLLGRWCVISFTAYAFEGSVAITFGLRAADKDEIRETASDALPDGRLRVAEGAGTTYRIIEQDVVVPALHGVALELMEVRDGGTAAGRLIASSVLRSFESLVETVRQHIRRNIARAFLDKALATLQERYGKATQRTMVGLLGSLNWRMMLTAAMCGAECLQVLEYVLANNPPTFHPLDFSGTPTVTVLTKKDDRLELGGVAHARALALLQRICGTDAAAEFRSQQRITVQARGYRFVLAPWQLVECTDPNGYKARLCIHTVSLSCNPIDELVIAWLNIKHRLADYLRTAHIIGAEPGFSVSP
jgi:hypothetical protein